MIIISHLDSHGKKSRRQVSQNGVPNNNWKNYCKSSWLIIGNGHYARIELILHIIKIHQVSNKLQNSWNSIWVHVLNMYFDIISKTNKFLMLIFYYHYSLGIVNKMLVNDITELETSSAKRCIYSRILRITCRFSRPSKIFDLWKIKKLFKTT